MMATRFVGLLLVGLLLSYLAVVESVAYSHQDADLLDYTGIDEVLEDDMEEEEEIRVERSRLLMGRRMGPEHVKRKPTRKCGHPKEGELNVECELKGRGVASPVNLIGHIPFSSDYRPPKPHPPKNN